MNFAIALELCLINQPLFHLLFYWQNLGNSSTIKVALYNITADPNEHVDLSAKFPDVVKKLQDRVQYYFKGMVPPLNKPSDPKATEVAKERGYWGPWRS